MEYIKQWENKRRIVYNGVVYTELNASDVANATKILLDVEKCPTSAILKVENIKDYDMEIQAKKFKQFKDRVNNMTLHEFVQLDNVMFRTFNFINTLEDMDIERVNDLQDTPKEDNISMTSEELMNFFNDKLSMDIE